RDVAERELYSGEAHGSHAERIDAQTDENLRAVWIAGKLTAHTDLPTVAMRRHDDALDHGQGARIERQRAVRAVLPGHHREEIIGTDTDEVGDRGYLVDLAHGARGLDHRTHRQFSLTASADLLDVGGAGHERQ